MDTENHRSGMKTKSIVVALLLGVAVMSLVSCTSWTDVGPDDLVKVTATITPLELRRALRIDYRFDRPVTEYIFQIPAAPVRSNWIPRTSGITIRDDAAHALESVQRMIFEIDPDPGWFDGLDPGLHRLDNGLVLDLDYFLGDRERYEMHIVVVADGSTLVTTSLDVALSAEPFEIVDPVGFAYLGDSGSVERDATIVVAEQAVPGAFVLGIDQLFADTAKSYSTALGTSLEYPPRAFLFLDQDKPLGFRGVVNENIAAFYLQGESWLNLDPRPLTQLVRYIRHEMFHMFGGQLHNGQYDKGRSAWMMEGAAEYFTNQPSDPELNGSVTPMQALFDQCLSMVGSQPVITNSDNSADRVPYTCGEFLFSFLALQLTSPDTVATIWREMLQPDSLNGTAFSSEELFRIVDRKGDGQFLHIADLLLKGTGLNRWHKIAGQFKNSGIEISLSEAQAIQAEGTRLIRQLLALHCPGPRGFKSDENQLTLFTPDCGGGLLNEAEITKIESHPVSDTNAWVDSMLKRCSTVGLIRFTLKSGGEMSVRCE